MGCNTICDLLDTLLSQILLNLPTKDSIKTSVLSTRWRNIWSSVPGLELVTYDFPEDEDLVTFMDRFMEFNNRSHLQNFKICYYNNDIDRVMELIGTVVDRGIQHLYVHMDHRNVFMLMNIYKSKKLVSVKLHNVELKNLESVVSLPCLKIMHLSNIFYRIDDPLAVEKLISRCPVLEDLKLVRPFDRLNEKVLLFLHVRSQTLQRFVIIRGETDILVEIDTPRLKYMILTNSRSDRIVVKNLSSLFLLNIHTEYNPLQPENLQKCDIFCEFLTRISSVRHMITCERTLEVLYFYSKLGPIPKFHNLYHLKTAFSGSLIQGLPVLLESCPNLKTLILDYYVTMKPCCALLFNIDAGVF